MAFLVLSSRITIGSFQFSGVHEVRIKRSLHNYVDTATIKIPSICRIVNKGQTIPIDLVTGKRFTDGDAVTIELGYDGNLKTEFKGFVKRRNLNMPLEVECEGYGYQLRRNTITGSYKQTTVAALLKKAVTGTDVKLRIDSGGEMPFSNVQFKDQTGAALIDWILHNSDGNLSICFIEPDVLYCGLLYTPYAQGEDMINKGHVEYRLGYNCIKDNSLKQRVPSDDPTQVSYGKRMPTGIKIFSLAQKIYYKRKLTRMLNKIPDSTWLARLANEKMFRVNYGGYEGKLTAFGEPYCLPGYVAYIEDSRYNERTGSYLVEGIEVTFGVTGFRRLPEIGPKVGFSNEAGWRALVKTE